MRKFKGYQPNMNKYSLKFLDEATAIAAMPLWRSTDNKWIEASHTHALVVFTPTHPTGVTVLIAGIVTPVMELSPGFHMNLQMVDTLPTELGLYKVTPTSPKLVWA